jgi:uncharacterized protein YdaU (DUF1376 family)
MKFYPHHIADYRSATGHLSNEEDVCYRRLIELYYDTELPIPDDIKNLSRRLRVSQDAVSTVLSDFFILINGQWHNERCDDEITRWYDKSAKAKASVEARWSKKQRNTDVVRTNAERNTERYDLDTTQDPLLSTSLRSVDKRASRFDAVASLLSSGVSEQVAKDWIKHRKEKRATVTQTVIDGHISEATKAGISLETALAYACSAGWQGFKADWYESKVGGKQVTGFKSEKQRNHEASIRAIYGTPIPNTEKLITGEIV